MTVSLRALQLGLVGSDGFVDRRARCPEPCTVEELPARSFYSPFGREDESDELNH